MMNIKGQTALVLILLAAGALIFLSITLNWGRIAQTKTVLSIAAYEAASQLASDGASYGEMAKQQDMPNKANFYKTIDWQIIFAFIFVVIAIVITILSWGQAWPLLAAAIAALVAAVATLLLTIVVIQPGMMAIWNKLQKDQPVTQQFFESGVGQALQGAATDQAYITDFFDSNANGKFGSVGVIPNDTVNRFAFFYTERLKMLNKGYIPQVIFFYNQVKELMNGETCLQNFVESSNYPGIAINPNCIDPATGNDYCGTNAKTPLIADPACSGPIPNGFILNDSCIDSNPSSKNFNPYCDACCQPLTDANGKAIRPSTCDQSTVPAECTTSANPYGSAYPFIFDASYQEYANQKSFLDLWGRDQQLINTATSLPLQSMTVQGNFPNGIYPLFWLMDNYSPPSPPGITYGYSPEVDNITLSSIATNSSQDHWCTTTVASTSTNPSPKLFPDLSQLTMSSCSGQDCCVNYLAGGVTSNSGGSAPLKITVGSGFSVSLAVSATNNVPVGSVLTVTASATDTVGITNVSFSIAPVGSSAPATNLPLTNYTATPALPSPSTVVTGDLTVLACDSVTDPVTNITTKTVVSGGYIITATATNVNGSTTSSSVQVTVDNPNVCSATDTCGTDSCGVFCGTTCALPQTCGGDSTKPNQCGCTPTLLCGASNCLKDNCGNPCPPTTCVAPKACNSSGVCQ